jgi:uncharacterized membrane protein
MPNDSYKIAWMLAGAATVLGELISVIGLFLAPKGSEAERRWFHAVLASVFVLVAWFLMDILLDHPGYPVLLRR